MYRVRPMMLMQQLPIREILIVILCIGSCDGCATAASSVQEGKATPTSSSSGQRIDVRFSDLTNLRTSEDDCDANEVPDSVDIARGYAHDVNRNGIIDYCERKFPPGTYDPDFPRWSSNAKAADTLALCRVFGARYGYSIQCYVPARGGDARLTVRTVDGKVIATISDCVRAGPSHYYWALRTSHGLLAEADSEYYFSLEHRGAEVRRAVRWGRGFRF